MREKIIVAKIEQMLGEIAKIDVTRIIHEFDQVAAVKRRNSGARFTLNDYTKAMVYTQLSNQKVWKDLVPKLPAIDKLFANWDYNKVSILAKNPEYLVDQIKKLRAGNRQISKQMGSLAENLQTLSSLKEEIESTYPTLKTRQSKEVFIAKWRTRISSSTKKNANYKLKQIGIPLASEMLKNLGLVSMKPDTHILRICGTERLGIFTTVANEKGVLPSQMAEAQQEFGNFAKEINVAPWYVVYLDILIWLFGATKYGEICTKTPRCNICLLQDMCNYPKKS